MKPEKEGGKPTKKVVHYFRTDYGKSSAMSFVNHNTAQFIEYTLTESAT